jgi:WD40 repeat protein
MSLLRKLELNDPMSTLAWSPDGNWLVAAGRENKVHVWNPQGWKRQDAPSPQLSPTTDISWQADSSGFATSSWDGTVCRWAVEDDVLHVEAKSKLGNHAAVAWLAATEGQRIITAGSSGVLRVWDDKLELLSELGNKVTRLQSLAWHPEGDRLAVVPQDGTVRVYDQMGRLLSNNVHWPTSWSRVAWDKAGQRLAVPQDKRILLLGSGDEQPIVLEEHKSQVRAVAWSFDSRLATAGVGNRVIVWHDGTPENSWNHGANRISSLAWNIDGMLAAACHDGNVRCWNVKGELVFNASGHQGQVRNVAWSPDGSRLVSCGSDRSIFVWSKKGEKIAELNGNTSGCNDVEFSPEGDRIGSGSDDGTVRVWNLNDPQPQVTLQVGQIVRQIAWHPDGSEFAAISDDNLLHFWDGSTFEPRRVIVFLSNGQSATFSAGGQMLNCTDDALDQLVQLSETADSVQLSPVAKPPVTKQ